MHMLPSMLLQIILGRVHNIPSTEPAPCVYIEAENATGAEHVKNGNQHRPASDRAAFAGGNRVGSAATGIGAARVP
jgi:hypothetical protein